MQKNENSPKAVQVSFPEIDGKSYLGTWGAGADIVFRNAFYMNFEIEFLDLNETYSISSFNTGLNFESGIIGEGWVISFKKVDDSTIIINWEGSHNKNLYYTDPWSWNIPKPYFSAKPKGSGVLSISLSMVKSGSNVQSKIRIEDDNYNLLLDKSGTFSIPSGSLYEKCLIFPETNPSITFNANKADGDNYHLDGNRVKITNLTLNDTELFLESSNKGDFAPLAVSARITDYIFPKLPNYSQLPGFYYDVNKGQKFKFDKNKITDHDEITILLLRENSSLLDLNKLYKINGPVTHFAVPAWDITVDLNYIEKVKSSNLGVTQKAAYPEAGSLDSKYEIFQGSLQEEEQEGVSLVAINIRTKFDFITNDHFVYDLKISYFNPTKGNSRSITSTYDNEFPAMAEAFMAYAGLTGLKLKKMENPVSGIIIEAGEGILSLFNESSSTCPIILLAGDFDMQNGSFKDSLKNWANSKSSFDYYKAYSHFKDLNKATPS